MMSRSQSLFDRARQVIPGGVNSPVRSFNQVGGTPCFIERGEGAYIFDADGHSYLDYVSSWGPLIHGHAHPYIIEKVTQALSKGMSYGAPTELEVEMAELICRLVPSIEKVRMVSSGTEATMSAIRLARGFTGRDKILKFVGHYHGHADSLLVKAGSGVLTLGIPGCPGIPQDIAQHTLTTEFNDLIALESVFAQYGHQLAAVILEPIACNMNLVEPQPEFLRALQNLCKQHQSLLIFDEVITGFRLGSDGAQGYLNIKPDLTTFGKIIGGGMPVGAYGGRAEIMDYIAPIGPVYQAGTLSGNPIAMTAGLATLELLQKPGFYEGLRHKTELLVNGLNELATNHQIPFLAKSIESIFGLFFTDQKQIYNYQVVSQSDIARFKKFFHAMLSEGIYFAPSAFEAGFISAAHRTEDIQLTLEKVAHVFRSL